MRHMKRFILFIILSTHLFAITGYVRLSGPSICMDNCSIYFLENENLILREFETLALNNSELVNFNKLILRNHPAMKKSLIHNEFIKELKNYNLDIMSV